MPDMEKAARVFKVLSAETRVRMIELLKRRPLCVNALAKSLNITPPAVSQHLRVMRDAGLVAAGKQGYFVHYRVNEETLADWNRLAKQILEQEIKQEPANSFFGQEESACAGISQKGGISCVIKKSAARNRRT